MLSVLQRARKLNVLGASPPHPSQPNAGKKIDAQPPESGPRQPVLTLPRASAAAE